MLLSIPLLFWREHDSAEFSLYSRSTSHPKLQECMALRQLEVLVYSFKGYPARKIKTLPKSLHIGKTSVFEH